MDFNKDLCDKEGINFALLSDTDRAVIKRYGVWDEKDDAAKRVTFLIDVKGVIRDVDLEVKPEDYGPTLIGRVKMVLGKPGEEKPGSQPAQQTPALGIVAGVVRYTGTIPEPASITVTDGSTIRHSDLAVDPKTKGLRDVMVLIEDGPVQAKVAGAKPVLMDQVDWVFRPRVVAVQHGQAVRFENSHGVNHSVMAVSTLPANEFNVFINSPVERVFEPQKPPVMIGCSLHTWMRAWVYVVQHPWFAVTDDQGKFRIENVPPGKYTLSLVHPDTKLRERRTIEVRSGKTVELAVEWPKAK